MKSPSKQQQQQQQQRRDLETTSSSYATRRLKIRIVKLLMHLNAVLAMYLLPIDDAFNVKLERKEIIPVLLN